MARAVLRVQIAACADLAYGGLVLDLGPRARVTFTALWLLAQGVLIATAGRRGDGSFGFRMFPEASTLRIQLSRVTKDGEHPAPGGEWSAHDAAGQLRSFAWRDRVRAPVLGSLDARVFAAYGAAAQLDRLQRALDDEARHLPDDAETERLVAHVTVWRNGREGITTVLQSEPRRVGSKREDADTPGEAKP